MPLTLWNVFVKISFFVNQTYHTGFSKTLILQTQEVEYDSKFVQEKKITKTYAADQANTSFGWVRMAAFVNCFKISGNEGGMFICWEQ